MKNYRIYLGLLVSAFLVAVGSCDKPDIVEPDEGSDTKDTIEVEAPDTTELTDTIVKPEEPLAPEGTFAFSISSDVYEGENGVWAKTWQPGDVVNVFTIQGSRHDDAERWVNHGKFTFNHTTDSEFVGDLNGNFQDGQTYLWHVLYPYSAGFIDPSGLDRPYEDQVVTIGHLKDNCLTQNGNNNTDHLSGPGLPLYGAAVTEGNEVPECNLHQMAAVVAVNVTNGTSVPLTVTDVKFAHSSEALTGEFAVDFGWVTEGFASDYLFRSEINASKESALKVISASPIPVNGSAKFYLPIMPNKFAAGSEWIVSVNEFKKTIMLTEEEELCSGLITPFDVTVVDPASLTLLSPSADSEIDLSSVERVTFSWNPIQSSDEYSILLSASEDMSDYQIIHAEGGSLSMKAQTLDYYAYELGLDFEESGKIYWTVVVRGDNRVNSSVWGLNITRRAQESYEDRVVTEKLTIPVAILIEDPVIPATGKRITETIHQGWGYKWNDPYEQMKEFERDMEASSHGVVQYEVVKIVDADRLFSYHRNSVSSSQKKYLTVDTLANYYFKYRPTSGDNTIDNAASYDYVGMMKYYGFDKMVDNGEIKEVWVYTHPTSGMNESRLIGEGAFWCNSMGIDVPEASNTELCCVMFCNYERTTDLAMHSYAHRVESIMSQVYERKGGFDGWNYDTKDDVEELTNWEKFSAHSLEYSKYKDGYAHIGMCHFPPNSVQDYDYGNTTYVNSFADSWYDYPFISEDAADARRLNREEWRDAGDWQWGYMKWYFGHLPHFKGICPRDGHLNNWWHYIVDYNNALILEERLRDDM